MNQNENSRNFAQSVLSFYDALKDDWQLPNDFSTIFPFDDDEVASVMSQFYTSYFDDTSSRIFLFGINPGRFGAGVTGISFTDPVILESICGIPNTFQKRQELSSQFVYEVVNAWGGIEDFYKHFYITSICPIGFLKDRKNANYYDDKMLEASVKNYIVESMWKQIDFGANRKIAFSMGQGTNFKKLQQLNAEHGFFEEVLPLPHPRWVLQYRRKKKDTFVDEYLEKLSKAIEK